MGSGNLHKALLHEDNLDIIFSFLDPASWKTARQVCRRWNDRLVSSFHKKQRLPLDRPREGEITLIRSVDKRLLSSISMLLTCSYEQKRMQQVFKYLNDSGNLARIRTLGLAVDEEAFGYFIKVINDGGFKGLKELELQAKCNNLVVDRYAQCAISGSLPALTHFKPRYYLTSSNDRGQHVLLAIQSIVSAAVNLESVDCSMPLDLSGRNVKKLVLNHSDYEIPHQYEDESSSMILSVRESLTFLKLPGNITEILESVFPKLKCLTYPYVSGDDITSPNLCLLPDLRKIRLPFDMVPWVYLPKALLPAGKLQDIKIWFHYIKNVEPEAFPGTLENYQILLNARLSRLRFHWSGFFFQVATIEKLLELLDADLREPGKGKSGVLEFIGMRTKEFLEIGPKNYGFCTKILEKLGGNWSVVRFIYERIPSGHIWNEMDVPLFGGKKLGKVKISQGPQKGPQQKEWNILSLEII